MRDYEKSAEREKKRDRGERAKARPFEVKDEQKKERERKKGARRSVAESERAAERDTRSKRKERGQERAHDSPFMAGHDLTETLNLSYGGANFNWLKRQVRLLLSQRPLERLYLLRELLCDAGDLHQLGNSGVDHRREVAEPVEKRLFLLRAYARDLLYEGSHLL